MTLPPHPSLCHFLALPSSCLSRTLTYPLTQTCRIRQHQWWYSGSGGGGGGGCHTFLVLFSPGLRPLNFLFLPRKHLRKLAIFTPFWMHDCHSGEYYIYGPQSNLSNRKGRLILFNAFILPPSPSLLKYKTHNTLQCIHILLRSINQTEMYGFFNS